MHVAKKVQAICETKEEGRKRVMMADASTMTDATPAPPTIIRFIRPPTSALTAAEQPAVSVDPAALGIVTEEGDVQGQAEGQGQGQVEGEGQEKQQQEGCMPHPASPTAGSGLQGTLVAVAHALSVSLPSTQLREREESIIELSTQQQTASLSHLPHLVCLASVHAQTLP